MGLQRRKLKGLEDKKATLILYRGAEYVIDFLPKIKLDIIVSDKMVKKVIEAISTAAHTGKIGDGKIFVSNIEEVVRIRTSETGESAI